MKSNGLFINPRGKGLIHFVVQLSTWLLKLSKVETGDMIRYVLG